MIAFKLDENLPVEVRDPPDTKPFHGVPLTRNVSTPGPATARVRRSSKERRRDSSRGVAPSCFTCLVPDAPRSDQKGNGWTGTGTKMRSVRDQIWLGVLAHVRSATEGGTESCTARQ